MLDAACPLLCITPCGVQEGVGPGQEGGWGGGREKEYALGLRSVMYFHSASKLNTGQEQRPRLKMVHPRSLWTAAMTYDARRCMQGGGHAGWRPCRVGAMQGGGHAGWRPCKVGFMQGGGHAGWGSCRVGFMQGGGHARWGSCRVEAMQGGGGQWRRPVSNGNYCAVLELLPHCLLDEGICLHIHVCSGFIQYQYLQHSQQNQHLQHSSWQEPLADSALLRGAHLCLGTSHYQFQLESRNRTHYLGVTQ